MSPIPLGILAASGAGGGGAFELIASTTLTSSSGSIDFNNIPQTYAHLEMRMTLRSSGSGYSQQAALVFNGDFSNQLIGWTFGYKFNNASNVITSSSGALFEIGRAPASSSQSGFFAASKIVIPFYSKTNVGKAFTSHTGYAEPWSHFAVYGSGSRHSTQAISAIRLYGLYGDFVAGSTISIYGWSA